MVKITGSMHYVETATRRILNHLGFRRRNTKMRHYIPDLTLDREYGARWGGYIEPQTESAVDTTLRGPRRPRFRTSTPARQDTQNPFRTPALPPPAQSSKKQPPAKRQKQKSQRIVPQHSAASASALTGIHGIGAGPSTSNQPSQSAGPTTATSVAPNELKQLMEQQTRAIMDLVRSMVEAQKGNIMSSVSTLMDTRMRAVQVHHRFSRYNKGQPK